MEAKDQVMETKEQLMEIKELNGETKKQLEDIDIKLKITSHNEERFQEIEELVKRTKPKIQWNKTRKSIGQNIDKQRQYLRRRPLVTKSL